jgi:DNA modification methylase
MSIKHVKVKISEVKLNPNNPRLIKDDKFAKLVQSIKDLPQMLEIRPIVVNSDMVVLGGNMRLKACKEAGLKQVPIIIADNLTEEQQGEFLIKDNVSGGEWDWQMIANDWDTEQLKDWGLDIPNFEDEQVLEAEEDDFEVPDGGIETDIVLGDLFEIGEHRLLCGDSTDVDNVLKLIGNDKKFSIYTDPPYGINEKGDRSERGGACQGNNLKDFKDDTIQYAVDAYNITREFNPLKEVWWGANYYCHHLPQTNNWLVWDKRVEENQRDTQSDCELAFINDGHSSIRIFRHLWKGMIKGSEHGQKRVHPTQKPIELASYCFNSYDMGNTILDLFGGSGSTMAASHQTKKRCLMMEFEPHYCQVIIDRMKKLDPTLSIKKNGEPYLKTGELQAI